MFGCLFVSLEVFCLLASEGGLVNIVVYVLMIIVCFELVWVI